MSKPLPCGACGIESFDVAMTLVEFPEEEQRIVPYILRIDELRPGEQATPIDVHERYAREPRCHDRDACAKRVAAFTPAERSAPVTEAADNEEDQIWR